MTTRTKVFLTIVVVFLIPLLLPEVGRIPVRDATRSDWNSRSFWYEPWGTSGVHKGIDIFAPIGRPVVAPTYGIVIYRGRLKLGGNVVAVLGPKWRIHYFAHLNNSSVRPLEPVGIGKALGTVGTTGNAAAKAPHLHYAVLSLVPRVWKFSTSTQGWKQMFFVDPEGVIGRQ